MADQPARSTDHGKVLHTWTFPEFPHQRRNRRWYTVAGVLGATGLVWALFSRNVLFAVILIIIAVVYVMTGQRTPRRIAATITEDGLAVDRSFYGWDEFEQFWLVYSPPAVKRLFLRFKAPLRPALSLELERENPVTLRKALLAYLKEDLEGVEPTADQVARLLKL